MHIYTIVRRYIISVYLASDINLKFFKRRLGFRWKFKRTDYNIHRVLLLGDSGLYVPNSRGILYV